MLRTFNCGIGMIVVVGAERADAVIGALREAARAPVVLGEVVASEDDARVVDHAADCEPDEPWRNAGASPS